jgi:hypothetical protein
MICWLAIEEMTFSTGAVFDAVSCRASLCTTPAPGTTSAALAPVAVPARISCRQSEPAME